MGHWVSLKEALMLPDRYGDISKREIAYEPDEGNIILKRRKTGFYAIQRFTTEKKLTWSPFSYKEEPYLIANGVTEKVVLLVGKRGCMNGRESINQVASLYGKKSIEAEGIGLTEEMFKDLPEYLRQLGGCYWLSYFYIDNYKAVGMKEFGFHWVSSGNIKDAILHRKWLGRVNYRYHIHVRPVVRLRSDIEVYFDKLDKSKPLEIRIRPSGINA